MNHSKSTAERESLVLRAIWMLVFFFVWQLAEVVLLVVVVVQLIQRCISGEPNRTLQEFGDSLSQYIAQIGRFGTFNTERKPWPLSDWPTPRPADMETVVSPVAEEPKNEAQP
ncbi:lipase [Stutzerimonas xanthomarina]|uniref:DUF4389 domain-containing protein n=1 Tax=Stutzerimonas nitrititolerans TaxID=2482751 RepID=UPI000823FD90|nr:DUF4389 domain-containing protein [Stutzerimonas nitrititolerans]OCX22382.1 lipase [Stutzerimonas xanthomarina]HCL75748.1 DUF4389 domain-containing protein [Pseudomonas sp.]